MYCCTWEPGMTRGGAWVLHGTHVIQSVIPYAVPRHRYPRSIARDTDQHWYPNQHRRYAARCERADAAEFGWGILADL